MRVRLSMPVVGIALSMSISLPATAADFSDQAVEQAIQRGVAYLKSQQAPEGNWPAYKDYPMGTSALAAYSLLTAGVSVQEPGMTKALEWLKTAKEDRTYSIGVRANVWLLANRAMGGVYVNNLRQDVATLIKSTSDGSYGYGATGNPAAGDNSCSQYGLLGVWAGDQGGLDIPREYWNKVLQHWVRVQCKDGGWAYTGNANSKATMTAAGVASLFVCADRLFLEAFVDCNRKESDIVPIRRGLEWLENNFAGSVQGPPNGYYLYGIERVALAGGYKYFGKQDWYKLGSTQLLNSQGKGGEWAGGFGPVVDTAFALLFLCRGRYPVLFNKLEFDGDWNNRPRDLAFLTQWTTDAFERHVTWQIINTKAPVSEWQDAPILYLSGSKKMKFTDEEVEKLRRYVGQGGTIFSTTACGGSAFSKAARDLYQRLFPQYPLKQVPPDHPLYNLHFRIPNGRPEMWMATNGIRPLVIHTDQDLSRNWQLGLLATAKLSFQAPANVYLYVTDKGVLRPRGTMVWPAEAKFQPVRTIRLARLKHSGCYDPEPLAYERFARLLGQRTGTKLEVVGPIGVEELASSQAPVASLTGVGPLQLTTEEQVALKQYVTSGGTLVIDAAGGSKEFAVSADRMLRELFGNGALKLLRAAHPLLVEPIPGQKDLALSKVQYRRAAKRLRKDGAPDLQAILLNDRPAVLFSALDITAGLVGCPIFGVEGYDPGGARDDGSAYRVLRNIVLHVASRQQAATALATAPAGAK